MLIDSIIQNIHYVSVNSKIDWCVSGEESTNQVTIPTMNSRQYH